MQEEITVHKEGRLQDDRRLCSIILPSLLSHLNANHNFALRMVSSGMTSEPLPFFKQALDIANVKMSSAKKSVKAGTAFFTDVLFSLAHCTRAQRDRFFSELQRIMACLGLELVIGSAPGVVVPVLSCAWSRTAVVSAMAADQ